MKRWLIDDFSIYTCSETIPVWTSDIIVIKRTAMQLLAQYIGSQKIKLVGVGFKTKGKRCESDAYFRFYISSSA